AANPDPMATRVLTKGEPISAPVGRADDFGWPRTSAPASAPPEPAAAGTQAPPAPPRARANQANQGQVPVAEATARPPDPQPAPRRGVRSAPRADKAPGPPLPINPFATRGGAR